MQPEWFNIQKHATPICSQKGSSRERTECLSWATPQPTSTACISFPCRISYRISPLEGRLHGSLSLNMSSPLGGLFFTPSCLVAIRGMQRLGPEPREHRSHITAWGSKHRPLHHVLSWPGMLKYDRTALLCTPDYTGVVPLLDPWVGTRGLRDSADLCIDR